MRRCRDRSARPDRRRTHRAHAPASPPRATPKDGARSLQVLRLRRSDLTPWRPRRGLPAPRQPQSPRAPWRGFRPARAKPAGGRRECASWGEPPGAPLTLRQDNPLAAHGRAGKVAPTPWWRNLMTDVLGDLDATGIAERIRAKAFTAQDAAEAANARIQRVNPQLTFLASEGYEYGRN